MTLLQVHRKYVRVTSTSFKSHGGEKSLTNGKNWINPFEKFEVHNPEVHLQETEDTAHFVSRFLLTMGQQIKKK